jgi:hypothetical protein
VAVKRAPYPSIYSRPVIIISAQFDNDNGSGYGGGYRAEVGEKIVGYVTYPPTLIWYHTDRAGEVMNARELMLMEGAHVVAGHSTPAFWKLANRQGPLPRPVRYQPFPFTQLRLNKIDQIFYSIDQKFRL